jgi:outer membrane protein OmpA-like peptidoglycan-associated protein
LGGIQVDFLNTIKNDAGGGYAKRMFTSNSNAATVGFELFPTKTVQIYGRYIYGLSDTKYDKNPNVGNLGYKYFNDGIQFGVKVKLFGKKAVPPVVPVVAAAPVDTDNDGIVDSLDKCPTVPGVAKYQGCPIPDTDGDGVNDEQDKCPTVPGLAKYAGCPIPDTDGDGVNDEQDKCPNEVGVASNYGCPDMTPVLTEAAKSFYFVINTAKLVDAKIAKSKFDPVLDLLAKYPKLQLEIQGNTDVTGNDKVNMPLSQKRANAVLKAFTDKGISADRLTTVANGSSKPKADNKTKAGRKENRNVTLVPSFKD